MRVSRTRLLVILCLAVLAAGVAASILVVGQPSNQCDNMAGTCIRERQKLAIAAVQFGAPLTAILGICGLVLLGVERRLTAVAVTILVLAGAFSVAVLATDPVPHLNNRWSGWLGDS